MPELRISLFGAPLIQVDEASIQQPRKCVALLAYLTVTRQPHTRDSLATFLWPDYSQTSARAALRQTFNTLKAALGDECFQTERETLAIKDSNDLWVDVTQFRRFFEKYQSHHHTVGAICPQCISSLTSAADLYRDHFMAGFSLRDSTNFDDWQSFYTNSFQHDFTLILEQLVNTYIAQGDFQSALRYGQRWLSLDYLHEPVYRYLMQLYAWTDQRAAALQQYEECQQHLAEIDLEPDQATTDLYEAIKQGNIPPRPTPPVKPIVHTWTVKKRVRHNLPLQPTTFVRREEERYAIAERLKAPACRLLTLIGLGGVGKTRLAIQVAGDMLDHFPQGAYFVSLSPLNDPQLIVPAIISALKLSLSTRGNAKTQLFNYLHEKDMLLIFDNFEHLVEGAMLLSELLEAAPQLKTLVTSRERLNLREEWLFEVEGMSFPAQPTLDVEKYDAVELFTQRVRQIQPKFSLPENIDQVAQICQLLEGMPLAIELAAAYVRSASCQDIAEQIRHDLDFLASPLRNIPERHRSLRAVFDHSWALLSELEQAVSIQLSVFRGGFSLEAASAIAGASTSILAALMDKSLIRTDANCYDIHELIRQYALMRLTEQGSLDTTLAKHLDFFLELAETIEPKLAGAEQIIHFNVLDQNYGNFLVALEWSIKSQSADAALRLCNALWQFWSLRSRLEEGRRWFDQVLALSADNTISRAKGLFNIGTLARRQGDYTAAIDYYQQSLALFEELQDQQGIAKVNTSLGMIALKQGNHDAACIYYEKGKHLFQKLNDKSGIALALNNLGLVSQVQGDYKTSVRLLQESLSLRREIHDVRGIADCIYNLGILAHDQNNLAEARQFYQESLDLFEQLNDMHSIGDVLCNLGTISHSEHHYDEAHSLLTESLEIRKELGDRRGSAFPLITLGTLALLQKEQKLAESYLQESLTIFYELSEKWNITYALHGLAEAASAACDLARAARLYGAIDEIRRSFGMQLPPFDQQSYDAAQSAVRDQLGDTAFEAAYAEGSAMTLDQAVAYALEPTH